MPRGKLLKMGWIAGGMICCETPFGWYTLLETGQQVGHSGQSQQIIRFGAFEVDLKAAELRKQGLRLRLQEQPFQVLAALLENPGEVVSREELFGRLWQDGTVVDFDRG